MTTGTLAPWASDPGCSRGRRFPEPESARRSAFQRDRDRVLHSRAFRRLMHKTQVFLTSGGDHHRTRLTHSLEVTQVARSMARSLGLNEDLTEAVSLAHDLGHPPFGHCGEKALNEEMSCWGGFDHNIQTLRILTRLETQYADFDGLNLTWETLEGVVKHNGPIAADDMPPAVRAYCAVHDLEVETFASAEAQVAGLADEIAYHGHDIDDGLRMGLFELECLRDVAVVGEAAREVMTRYPDAGRDRQVHETVRRIIDRLANDLVGESESRLAESGVASADDVRWHSGPLVGFSAEVARANTELQEWLYLNMYSNDRLREHRDGAEGVVHDLFCMYRDDPLLLPPEWRARRNERDTCRQRMRVVADYIAGMTDRFARDDHQRLKA